MTSIRVGSSSGEASGGTNLYAMLFISHTSPRHVVTNKSQVPFRIDLIFDDVIVNPGFTTIQALAIPYTAVGYCAVISFPNFFPSSSLIVFIVSLLIILSAEIEFFFKYIL
jgi:hypothetical protein